MRGGGWNSAFLGLVSVLNFSFGAVVRRHHPWEPNICFFCWSLCPAVHRAVLVAISESTQPVTSRAC